MKRLLFLLSVFLLSSCSQKEQIIPEIEIVRMDRITYNQDTNEPMRFSQSGMAENDLYTDAMVERV